MPKLRPIKRKDLIYYFEQLGFDGPFSGGNHQYMMKGRLKVYIPNPHEGDIGRDFLVRNITTGWYRKNVMGKLVAIERAQQQD